MRKFLALFLIFAFVFGMDTAASVHEEPPLAQGIDLSQENGSNVDWTLVSYDLRGKFAILCAYDGEEDPSFAANYEGAKVAGVSVGAYCRLSGNTADAVRIEMIDFIRNVLDGKQFEYPIYVAVDNQEIYGEVGSQTTTELVEIACKLLTASGYYAGVYTTIPFSKTYIDMNQLTEYTVWICQPEGGEKYTGDYDMEQYRMNGRIAGMKSVHINNCYMDFPSLMKEVGLNGYIAPEKPVIPTNTDVGFFAEASSPKPKGYKGDVELDGNIDAKDAWVALQISVNKREASAHEQDAADVDNSTIVNAKDALEILKYAVGKESVLTENRVTTEVEDANAYAYWDVLYDNIFTTERIWLCENYEQYQKFFAFRYAEESQRKTGFKVTLPEFNEEFFQEYGLVLWYRCSDMTTGSLHYSGGFVQDDRLYLDITPYGTDALDERNALDSIYGFCYAKGENAIETVIIRKNYVEPIHRSYAISQFEL